MHSIIAPSSAARRVQCPASALLEAAYPDEPTEASREGDAVHALAADMVRAQARAEFNWPKLGEVLDNSAPNGVIYTAEMYDAAELYALEIGRVMRATGVFTPHVEERVDMTSIHPKSFGMPDCWLYDPAGNTLYLWDLKYGYRVVEAEGNRQLVSYAAGALEATGAPDEASVVLSVIQPRAPHRDGPIRHWRMHADMVWGYAERLAEVEAEALGDSPRYRTGPECRYCRARHDCPTLTESAHAWAEYADHAPPLNLGPQGLGLEKRMLEEAIDVLTFRLTGIDAQITRLLEQGEAVPGYALETTWGRKKWTKPADAVFLLGDLLGVELRKPAEPITPTQAVKAGIDSAVISGYCETPATGKKLINRADSLAARIFRKLED